MSDAKKYTVKDFCKKYNGENSEQLKEILIKSVMNVRYVPYEIKITICKKIIESAYYQKNDVGSKTLHVNSTTKHMLYHLYLVKQYTHIDVDFTNCLDEFNLLNKNGLFDIIFSNISNKELDEFNMILNMVESDIFKNEYNTRAFISNQVERFGELFGHIAEPALNRLTEVLENMDEKTVDNIVNKLKTFNGIGGLKNKINILK